MHGAVLSRTNCLSGRALVTVANLDGRPAHVDLGDIDLLSDLKDWKLQLSTEARKGGKEPRVDTIKGRILETFQNAGALVFSAERF